MNAKDAHERCPLCEEAAAVRPKLLLIEESWVPAPGKDPHLAYFADLRVDDVKPEHLSKEETIAPTALVMIVDWVAQRAR